MPSTTLRPAGLSALYGSTWTPSTGTLYSVTSDDSDATYASETLTSPGAGSISGSLALQLPSLSIPSTAQVRSVGVRLRCAATGATSGTSIFASITNPWTAPAVVNVAGGLSSTPTTFGVGTWIVRRDGLPFTSADLAAGLVVYIQDNENNTGATVTFTVYEVYVDVVWNLAPTTTTSGPGGTITTSTRPLIAWSYSDPDGDAQERYWAKVFTSAMVATTGFSPDSPSSFPAYWDSGETYGAATSLYPGIDLANGSYVVYVKTADVGSTGRYSPWSTSSFTISVTYPAQPTIASVIDLPNARSQITLVQASSPGYTNVAMIVESSDDGGATWGPIRSSPVLSPATAPVAQTISAVGTLVSNVATPQLTTLSVTTHAIGNVLMVAVESKFLTGQNYTCTGLSGGGCTTWKKAGSFIDSAAIHEIGIWYGVVTSVTTANIVATFSNSGTQSTEISCQEFSSAGGSATTWAPDVFASRNDSASTTPHYPSLTPAGTNELYFGFIQWPGSGSSGGTSGFTYQADANGNQVAYNVNVGTTVSPVASSASQISSSAAVLMTATMGGSGGTVTTYDWEIRGGIPRIYRAKATGLISGSTLTGPPTTPTLPITFFPPGWFLKNPLNPTQNLNNCIVQLDKEKRVERMGVFEPLGRNLPVIVADTLGGWDSTITLVAVSAADVTAIEAILGVQNALLLQSPKGENRYIRITDRGRDRGAGWHRKYPCAYREVLAPPGSIQVATGVPAAPPPPPPPPPGFTNPSGIAMPNTDLPGWRLIFNDDFNTDVAIGNFPAAVSNKWTAYPWGPPPAWHDTSGNGFYNPQKVLYQSGSCLNMNIHSEIIGGVDYHLVAGPVPILPGIAPFKGQLYGRYAVCFRSDVLVGYKTAWLLWPDSDNWPTDGEIDFPEANLDGTDTIQAYMHWQGGTSGSSQDAYTTGTVEAGSGWHTAVVEWSSASGGTCKFILDGTTVGTSTGAHVPNTRMHFILQTETRLSGGAPPDSTNGLVQVDWVAIWAPA